MSRKSYILYESIVSKTEKKPFINLGTQNTVNFETMFPKIFKKTRDFVNKTPKLLVKVSMRPSFLPKVYFDIKVKLKRLHIKVKKKMLQ